MPQYGGWIDMDLQGKRLSICEEALLLLFWWLRRLAVNPARIVEDPLATRIRALSQIAI